MLLPALKNVGEMDALLSRPVSFSAYMDIFADNYTDLLVLLGGSFKPMTIHGKYSRTTFTPLRKRKWTMAMRITYEVLREDGSAAVAPLDAVVHIYYDTWQVELVKVYGVLRNKLQAYDAQGAIVKRWLLNTFLRRVLKTIAYQVTSGERCVASR